MHALFANFSAAFSLELNAANLSIHDRAVAFEAALTTSDAWSGCLNMGELELANSTNTTVVHVATKACYASPGSTAYDSDVCCNPGFA
jgi:hypothetical protein